MAMLLGKKVGMTRVYDESGALVPVTVIEAGPCTITQVKTTETDGYDAIQVGFEDVKPSRRKRPQVGHAEKAGTTPKKFVREWRLLEKPETEFKPGDSLTVSVFAGTKYVDVTGTSKGKGYAGTAKRHNFGRGPMSHGSKSHRRPGSTGATDAARVLKGVKKAGQMGNERVTVKGLRVVRVDAARNLLLISGSVPGSKGSIVEVRAVESFDEEI